MAIAIYWRPLMVKVWNCSSALWTTKKGRCIGVKS